MKKSLCIVIVCVTILCCFPANAIGDNYYYDEVKFHGYPVNINAIADLRFPLPLKQIILKGSKMEKSSTLTALKQTFALHPDFEYLSGESHYLKYGVSTLGDNWAYTPIPYRAEIDKVYPIKDPVLADLFEKCLDFLSGIGITGNPSLGFACYFSGHDLISPPVISQDERNRIRILIPYTIGGLSTEYRNMIVNRDSLPHTQGTSMHILDYPFAVFAFDMHKQLIAADLACYAIESETTIDGNPIPWQQAITAVLDHVLLYNPSRKDLSIEEYTNVYFSKYTVRIARVFPLWLSNWSNVLLPGWCIQIHLYDRISGKYVLAYELAVNALTTDVCDIKQPKFK